MLYFPKKKLLLFFLDMIFISVSFCIGHIIRFQKFLFNYTFFYQLITINIVFTLTFYVFDLYNLKQSFGNVRFFLKFVIITFIGFFILSFVFYFFPYLRIGRSILIITYFYIGIFGFLVRYFFEKVILNVLIGKKHIVIIGCDEESKYLFEALKKREHIHIKSFIMTREVITDFYLHPVMVESCERLLEPYFLKDVERVVIATKEDLSEEILKCILFCKSKHIDVVDMPTFFEEVFGKVPVNFIDYEWFIASRLYGLKKTIYNMKLKSIIDRFLALIGLILSMPLLILSILLVIFEDGFPVFFKQKRVGKDGKLFTSYKLRTMKVGMENKREKAGEIDDPRITKVGKYLRKFRIDEIPQMWNVLKGDMSFIGPRALIPEEVEYFEKEIPFFSFRHNVKPGITGWAQVNYKHGAKIEDAFEKLQYDLFYIKNLSPLLDLYIFLKTIKVVIWGHGAR